MANAAFEAYLTEASHAPDIILMDVLKILDQEADEELPLNVVAFLATRGRSGVRLKRTVMDVTAFVAAYAIQWCAQWEGGIYVSAMDGSIPFNDNDSLVLAGRADLPSRVVVVNNFQPDLLERRDLDRVRARFRLHQRGFATVVGSPLSYLELHRVTDLDEFIPLRVNGTREEPYVETEFDLVDVE